MKLTRIVWTCEECGAEFSREVKEVLSDDGTHVEVIVELKDFDTEGPLCDNCFGPETTEEAK